MADEKKSGDGGSKKGQFNATEITKVPAPNPGDQRNIPYGSVVIPQQPASTQPAATGSGGTGGSDSSGVGDGGGQSGSEGSKATEGGDS